MPPSSARVQELLQEPQFRMLAKALAQANNSCEDSEPFRLATLRTSACLDQLDAKGYDQSEVRAVLTLLDSVEKEPESQNAVLPDEPD